MTFFAFTLRFLKLQIERKNYTALGNGADIRSLTTQIIKPYNPLNNLFELTNRTSNRVKATHLN